MLLISRASCQTMTVTATSSVVSTVTDYQFSIQNTDSVDIPAGSVLVISFPVDYVSLLNNGAYNCTYTSWFQSVTLSCSISGLVLTVSGGFPVDRPSLGQVDNYTFVVYNITNPPYATYTDVFNGEFDDSNGNQLMTMQSNGGSGILLQAGTLSTYQVMKLAALRYRRPRSASSLSSRFRLCRPTASPSTGSSRSPPTVIG